jgi:hypothetical protein
MSNIAKSKLAMWLSGIYLVFALGSWVLPLIAKPDESMAGIFLVLFAQPWVSLWGWMSNVLQIDSFALNMAVLLAGILMNTWIIYHVVSWLSRR